jgi:hypothetical protein
VRAQDTAPPAQAGIDAAKAAVTRAKAAYLDLKTYSDTTQGRYEWKAKGLAEQASKAKVSCRFSAPRSFHVSTPQDALIADGETLFKVVHAAKKYTQEPMPAEIDPQQITEGMPSQFWLAPPQMSVLARGRGNPELLLKSIVSLERLAPRSS